MRQAFVIIGGLTVVLFARPGYSQWVQYINETATRFDTTQDPNGGASVVQNTDEKDYAWDDIDKDGDIDLVVVQKSLGTTTGRRRNVLLMNEGGVLVDRTTQFASNEMGTIGVAGSQGFLDLTNDRDVILVDVNNDTWLDVVTATTLSGGPGGTSGVKMFSHPRIYINRQNDGGGNWLGFIYDDVDRVPTQAAEPRFCSVAAGDLDGDGDQDLIQGDYQQGGARVLDLDNRIWINSGVGSGIFVDESTLRMTNAQRDVSFGMATAIVDMNGDNALDVVVDDALSFPTAVSIIYNDPNNLGFFQSMPRDFIYNADPYHIIVGNLNNDALPDIVVTDDAADRYLLNTGNGPDGLANFTTGLLIGSSATEFGGNNFIADLNKDGFNDVLVANVDVDLPSCDEPSKIFRNLGVQPDNFSITLQQDGNLGIAQSHLDGVHDFAVFDLDGDTWLDLVIGTCNGSFVYLNQPPTEGLLFNYPDGLPNFLPQDQLFTFRVAVTAPGVGGDPDPDTGTLFLSTDGGPFAEVAMEQESPDVYLAKLPAGQCPQRFRFYFRAERDGVPFTDPEPGDAAPFEAFVAEGSQNIVEEHVEGDVSDWTVVNDPGLTSGAWEQADPIETGFLGKTAAPGEDAEAPIDEVMAFVTENCPTDPCDAGTADIDGGGTELISPLIDLNETDGVISYFRWFYTSSATPGDDTLTAWIANDGDQPAPTWVLIETVESTDDGDDTSWEGNSFLVSDFVMPTANIRVRFRAQDTGTGSVVEAGIDLFKVDSFSCPVAPEPCDCAGDVVDDGAVNGVDVQGFVDCMLGGGTNCGCADIVEPGVELNDADVDAFVSELLTGTGCN